jgi:DNA-binding MarR family transcriptional regulator
VTRKKPRTQSPLGPAEYETLAAFRFTLRRFIAFSDRASAEVGLTQQQYQALLALRAHPGPDLLTISELAALLLVKHHSAVGLVDRLEKLALVRRAASAEDRRKVRLALTARGERVFGKLAVAHRAELRRIGPDLERFAQFLARPEAAKAVPRTARPGRPRRA